MTPIRSSRQPGPALLAAVILAILILYHDTFWSMVLLWSRSQTFAHGFVIVPISAWLAWKQRHRLAAVRQRPSAGGLLLLLGLGPAWLLASIAHVQVVAQYAATAMIPAAAIAILGWRAAATLAFPLAYLLLAVPFGEVFIPALIDFTAQFTVGALQLTGVPVFRENNNFSIPSGNWSVVEACSGLRYVIASLAVGTLYAYLNYRSARRRLICIGISLLLPILANGIRAYLIVMLGHWSDMQLAVGVDHLIYGWLFFGLVCVLLFWLASFWREAPAPARTVSAPAESMPGMPRAAAGCLAIAAAWPLLAAPILDAPVPAVHGATPLAVATAPAWVVQLPAPDAWRAPHAGAPVELLQGYRSARGDVTMQLAWYPTQGKDAELLAHLPSRQGDPWFALAEGSAIVAVGQRTLKVKRSILQGKNGRLLVWRWYRQSGVDTDSAFLVKLLLAKARLMRSPEDGADIILSAPYQEAAAPPEPVLREFLAAMLPAIDKGFHDAGRH